MGQSWNTILNVYYRIIIATYILNGAFPQAISEEINSLQSSITPLCTSGPPVLIGTSTRSSVLILMLYRWYPLYISLVILHWVCVQCSIVHGTDQVHIFTPLLFSVLILRLPLVPTIYHWLYSTLGLQCQSWRHRPDIQTWFYYNSVWGILWIEKSSDYYIFYSLKSNTKWLLYHKLLSCLKKT